MSTPAFDVTIAHRWFAIEFNNAAWDLIDLPQRTVEQNDNMLAAALASRQHWYQVGTLINKLRAESLVAAAYLNAGWPDLSLHHARLCHALSDQAGEDQTPFDRACVFGGLACALAKLDQWDEARERYSQALTVAHKFEDPEELPVFERLYHLDTDETS